MPTAAAELRCLLEGLIPHVDCTEPPANTPICRFIDLPKFRDLFANEELYFRRTDLFKGYLQLKKGDVAAAEFRKVLDHSGVVQGFVTGALSILQLARAQVLMHDEEAARKSFEDFLALWKNADRDLPIYEQAKAEYAVLRKTAQ